jgi:hypothetical protein
VEAGVDVVAVMDVMGEDTMLGEMEMGIRQYMPTWPKFKPKF